VRAPDYSQPQSTEGCAAIPAAERQLTIAVGFSPRTNNRTVPRRGATFGSGIGGATNRSAVAPRLRILFFVRVPWAQAHGYHRRFALRERRRCPNSALRRYP